MLYITTKKERNALKGKTTTEILISATRRVKNYWSLDRCMSSLDIIQEENGSILKQNHTGRLIIDIIVARVVSEIKFNEQNE
jgi:hypothetical protein